MSELLDGSQDSKPIPDCHDPSPAYDLGSSPDLLTSVMENERTRRLILQQLDKTDAESENLLKNHPINNRKLDYMELIEFMEWFGPWTKKQGQFVTEGGKLLRKFSGENVEIWTASQKLSNSEFNRAYASLKRNPNSQVGVKLAQDSQDYDDSFLSSVLSEQLYESSEEEDDMDDKVGQSLPSYEAVAKIQKATGSAPAKPRRFWKKFWKFWQ